MHMQVLRRRKTLAILQLTLLVRVMKFLEILMVTRAYFDINPPRYLESRGL